MNNIIKIVEDYKNKIGNVVGTSNWIKIDQDMINNFATCLISHSEIYGFF